MVVFIMDLNCYKQSLCFFTFALSQLKDSNVWENIHADLKGQTLRCYQTKEDLESGNNLMLLIPIRKVSSFQKSCKRREVPSSSYSLMQKPPEGSSESTQTDTDRSAPCTITHTCLSGVQTRNGQQCMTKRFFCFVLFCFKAYLCVSYLSDRCSTLFLPVIIFFFR